MRRIQVEFADQAAFTYVMGGLAREFKRPLETMRHVLDAAEESGMPVDPRLWTDAPPTSSYPACQAVKAAAEQNLDGLYLRAVREGLMCFRRKLDTADALIDAAREVPGMDVERFAIDLRSHAIAEAFGADLDRTRSAAPEHRPEGKKRVPFPSFEARGEDGAVHGVYGDVTVERLREAVLAAGADPGPLPGVLDALARYRRMAAVEVAAVCDLPGPRAPAELWRAAQEWQVRPQRVLTGELFSAA